ncbi:MAG: di-heme oxidoredictase family protein [Terriglobia bacterium]
MRTIKTAPAGTLINGGTFKIPEALGKKTIHPFSDFLLHDVGTGDGIVQIGGQSTANKMRTAPLWGLSARPWMMHDGKSQTMHLAIIRHRGEASFVIESYERLTPIEKHQLREFLNSL